MMISSAACTRMGVPEMMAVGCAREMDPLACKPDLVRLDVETAVATAVSTEKRSPGHAAAAKWAVDAAFGE